MTCVENIARWCENQLFLGKIDNELANFIDSATELWLKFPQIRSNVVNDLDTTGLEEKRLRLADKRFDESLTPDFPNMRIETIDPVQLNDLHLETGAPRLHEYVVYLFAVLEGYFTSLTDKASWSRIVDSMAIRAAINNYVKRFPSRTAVFENVRKLSLSTLELIWACQMDMAKADGLDDFKVETVDSTSVESVSAWPTDTRLILGFMERAYNAGRKLSIFGLPIVREWHMPRWLEESKGLLFLINTNCAKANRIFKKAFAKFLKRAWQMLNYMMAEYDRLEETIPEQMKLMRPSRRCYSEELWDKVGNSLVDCLTLYNYAEDRFYNGAAAAPREENEKIFSLSDAAASFINKGGRKTVFGYKPQLGRSNSGFITAFLLEKGNPADSDKLVELAMDHFRRTGVKPVQINADDGYSSTANVERLLSRNFGVSTVSLSGAKGKNILTKLFGEDYWNSPELKKLRNDRSAVESLMFVLKFNHEFGQMRRCGLENVRQEMTTKIIAYNFWRIALLRKRKKKKLAA